MENSALRMLISLMTLLILSACVNCRFVHKIEDWNTPMPESVAECRRGCLMKFLELPLGKTVAMDCTKKSNCFMCWDYCSMLHRNRKKKAVTTSMCTDSVCFAGCKFACNYHQYLLAKPMHRTDFFN